MEKAIEVATPKSARVTAKKRQSMGRVKNHEKEVGQINAIFDNDTEEMTTEPEINSKDLQTVATPKRLRRTGIETTLLQTPKSESVAQAEQLQTPRRSVRKSIKPIQDYEDIVAKKSLRSSKKGEKQSSVDEETEQEEEKEAPKWTPAKVGRVSQKRKSRKSRKNVGKKPQEYEKHNILVDVDVLEVIANDEDENKENVEPQELLRNRKIPKDTENKGSTTRRSQETFVSLSAEKAKEKVKLADAHTQPLVALSLEEVKAKEKCSPKASIVKQEYVKQSKKQKESEELSELGLNPIALDKPDLPSIFSDKQKIEDDKIEDEKIEDEKIEDEKIEDEKIEDEKIEDVKIEDEKIEDEKIEDEKIEDEKIEDMKIEDEKIEDEKIELELETEVKIKDQAEVRVEEVVATSILTAEVPGNKIETIITEEVLLEGHLDNIIMTFVENKEVPNSTFDSTNNMKEPLTCEKAPLDDKSINLITPNSKETTEADTTIDTSDCIMIISPEPEHQSTVLKKENYTLATNVADLDTYMPPLLISDDEEQEESKENSENLEPQSAKITKVCFNNEEHGLHTPKKDPSAKLNIVTPLVATNGGTPKMSKTKPYRFPTPYKRRVPKSNPFQFDSKANEETNTEEDISNSALPRMVLTNLEPKEIVLRSIRKRSFSVCNDRISKKQINRVTFNSPANQTTVIEDIDIIISKSVKKGVRLRGGHVDSVVSDTRNVTKRRKRSLSLDETLMLERLNKVQQAPLTPSKLKSTPQKLQSRTKIPNFAAIHQRHFNNMENILDHVTRKAERAKVLTTSASKLRGTSAQKSGFSSNNQNIEPIRSVAGGSVAGTPAKTHARVGKPKALKKIDLFDNTINPVLPVTAQKLDDDEDRAINLPKPTAEIAIVRPMPSGKKLQNMQAKKIVKTAQPIQIQQPKPAFNLSTNIKKQTAQANMVTSTSSTSTSFINQPSCANTTITTTTTKSLADKVAARRQRHIEMFKGRSGSKVSTDKDKSIEIIRGVRSNRRFDLQMQHRKNLNNDH